MNWEDANMLAVRENKLVLVAAGVQPDKKLFSNPDISIFWDGLRLLYIWICRVKPVNVLNRNYY